MTEADREKNLITLTMTHPNPPNRHKTDPNRLSGFRFFWLKYVIGSDTRVHCASSLKGQGSKKVGPNLKLNYPHILAEAHLPGRPWTRPMYLCGVSPSWETNFHLVFEACEGAEIRKTLYNGYELVIAGAREIEIKPLEPGFRGLGPEFTTCRNFQYAVQLEAQGL